MTDSETLDKFKPLAAELNRTTLPVSLFIIDFELLGPDWKWGNQDGGAGNIGRVFSVDGGVVKVRLLRFVKTDYNLS